MDHVTTIPTQGQILVNIEDMSMLKDIKKAISMVKSVGKSRFLVASTFLHTSVRCVTLMRVESLNTTV